MVREKGNKFIWGKKQKKKRIMDWLDAQLGGSE